MKSDKIRKNIDGYEGAMATALRDLLDIVDELEERRSSGTPRRNVEVGDVVLSKKWGVASRSRHVKITALYSDRVAAGGLFYPDDLTTLNGDPVVL